MTDTQEQKKKTYAVKRIIVEHYQVEASSKKEAESICTMNGDPHHVEMKSIKITLEK